MSVAMPQLAKDGLKLTNNILTKITFLQHRQTHSIVKHFKPKKKKNALHMQHQHQQLKEQQTQQTL